MVTIPDDLRPADYMVLDKFVLDFTYEAENGAFTADVWLDGEQFSVENDGDGDENLYLALDEASHGVLDEFRRCARIAYPNKHTPEDYALLWLELRYSI